jgi:hypothetical protein
MTLAACADTNAPLPDPVEVLLVVNRVGNSLSIVQVDEEGPAVQVSLGGAGSAPTTLAARNAFAVVPLGPADAVAVVDLRAGVVERRIPLPEGSGATGVAMVDDSIAYVGNPDLNTVSRVNYLTGSTSGVAAGGFPQALVFTRGRVFVLNGNLDQDALPLGESWMTVVDPVTNEPATGIDSIALSGQGNAVSAAVGADGLLYLIVAGNPFEDEGRLSIVDPVARVEVASFSGLGKGPGHVAVDGEARVFVSSRAEGLLEFNTDSNTVVRGPGEGVRIPTNSAVAVDSRGRVYAIEAGDCDATAPGRAHVLSGDLEEDERTITLGRCPVAAVTVRIPPE